LNGIKIKLGVIVQRLQLELQEMFLILLKAQESPVADIARSRQHLQKQLIRSTAFSKDYIPKKKNIPELKTTNFSDMVLVIITCHILKVVLVFPVILIFLKVWDIKCGTFQEGKLLMCGKSRKGG